MQSANLQPNQQRIGEISVFRDYIQERAHFPPILNKFIYYLNKILEFCPQNLSARSWQNFGTLEFRYFVKVVNKLIQNRWEVCPFLYIISEYRDFYDPLLVGHPHLEPALDGQLAASSLCLRQYGAGDPLLVGLQPPLGLLRPLCLVLPPAISPHLTHASTHSGNSSFYLGGVRFQGNSGLVCMVTAKSSK